MAFVKSIGELSYQQLRETWYNCSIIYSDLYDFFRNSLPSVLDDTGFDLDRKNLPPSNFLENLTLSISCVPARSMVREDVWERISDGLDCGIWMDEEKSNRVAFYVEFFLHSDFAQNCFHRSSKAAKWRDLLQSDGWEFQYIDDNWQISLFKPSEEIDFSRPGWKRDVKKFFEVGLTQLAEKVFSSTEKWMEIG